MEIVPTMLNTNDFLHRDYDRHEYLDDKGQYLLHWRVDDPLFTFAAEVATTGWIGLGINTVNDMVGADMAIGWIDEDGNTHLHDRTGTGHFLPLMDAQQDLFRIKGAIIPGSPKPEPSNALGFLLPLLGIIVALTITLQCLRRLLARTSRDNIAYERVAQTNHEHGSHSNTSNGRNNKTTDEDEAGVLEMPPILASNSDTEHSSTNAHTRARKRITTEDDSSTIVGKDGPIGGGGGTAGNVSLDIAATLDGIAHSLRELGDGDDENDILRSKTDETVRSTATDTRKQAPQQSAVRRADLHACGDDTDVYDDSVLVSNTVSPDGRHPTKVASKFDSIYD